MKKAIAVLVFVLFSFVVFAAHGSSEEGLSADKAMEKLEKGNKRYTSGKMTHKNQGKKRRAETAKTQEPFAVIVTCSDSRVSPEVLFDLGMGDIFVVRSAGNIVDDIGIGSIEYAVEHLGAKLIVVLGHERCGAVKATVDGGEAPGHIKKIVEKIKPSVEKAKKDKGDLLDNSIMKNVTAVVKELANAKPFLKEKAASGEIKVVGAYYDLDSGKVSGVQAE